MKRIFNAMSFLEGIDIQGMKLEELLQTIKILTDDKLDKAHSSYYVDRLEAISLLVNRAIEENSAESSG